MLMAGIEAVRVSWEVMKSRCVRGVEWGLGIERGGGGVGMRVEVDVSKYTVLDGGY